VDTDVLTIGTFDQFEARVDNPTSICSYDINGVAPAAIEIAQSLSFSIVDLLMGGRGYPPVETRPLSPLEQSLLGGLFEALGDDMQRAWSQLVPESWKVAEEAQFTYALEGFAPEDPTIIAAFDVGIEGLAQGAVHVALPLTSVVPPEHRVTPRSEEDPLASPLASGLPMHLDVVLPPVLVTLAELLEVDVGNVLEFADWEVPTDEGEGMEVVVRVEGKACYRGRLGTVHNKKAVEIREPLTSDDIRTIESF
jgi:flagellar motor switch protein FliM